MPTECGDGDMLSIDREKHHCSSLAQWTENTFAPFVNECHLLNWTEPPGRRFCRPVCQQQRPSNCAECCRWDGINYRWQFAEGNKTRTWIERESLWNFGREAIGANPPRRQTGGRMRRVNVGRCRYRGGQMNACVKMGNVRLGRTDWNNRATLLARATKHGGLSSTFFPFFVSFSSSAFTYTHGISMADKQAKG